jgi:hypothetical protein
MLGSGMPWPGDEGDQNVGSKHGWQLKRSAALSFIPEIDPDLYLSYFFLLAL